MILILLMIVTNYGDNHTNAQSIFSETSISFDGDGVATW